MRFNFMPIMIGVHDKPNKTCVIAKDTKYGGYSLFICWLKGDYKYGEVVKKEDIGKIICHLHFCNFEAAKAFLGAVQTLVDNWEGEDVV